MGASCCKSETTRSAPAVGRPNTATFLVSSPPSVICANNDLNLSAGTDAALSHESVAAAAAAAAQPAAASAASALLSPADVRQRRIHSIYTQNPAPFRALRCPLGSEMNVQRIVGPGVLYLLEVAPVWYLYNDSLYYEASVDCRVGPDSVLIPMLQTPEAEVTEDGWHRIRATVGPLQTVPLVAGTVCGMKCALGAQRIDVGAAHTEEDETIHAAVLALGEESAEQAMQEVSSWTASIPTSSDRNNDAHMMGQTASAAEAVLQRCIVEGRRFVDVSFPPTARAMWRHGIDAAPPMPAVTMLRPSQYLNLHRAANSHEHERNENGLIRSSARRHAVMVVDVAVPQAISGGYLGDSWLVSAISLLAERGDMVRAMLSQTTPAEAAVGAYRVRLCVNGWWQTVLVDDYMPTRAGVPLCAHSVVNMNPTMMDAQAMSGMNNNNVNHNDNNNNSADDAHAAELWVSLLHKAYAKAKGSYAAVRGGEVLEALRDMTGRVGYRFNTEWQATAAMRPGKPRVAAIRALAARLMRYGQAGHMIILSTSCVEEDAHTNTNTNNSVPPHKSTAYSSIQASRSAEGQSVPAKASSHAAHASVRAAGLMPGYSYCCDRVVQITTAPGKTVWLLHIRNPWQRAASYSSSSAATSMRWRGAWSEGSAEWRQYPHAAEACGCPPPPPVISTCDAQVNYADLTHMTAAEAAMSLPDASVLEEQQQREREEGAFWISLRDAMRYFGGAAVLYRGAVCELHTPHYAAQGYFDNATPSVCLELTVSATSATERCAAVPVTLTLTQADKRGMLDAAAAASARSSAVSAASSSSGVSTSPMSVMYAPIMLSVARLADDGRIFAVEVNSSADPAYPTAALQFGVSREVSVTMMLQAGSRYVVLPRVHHTVSAPPALRAYTLGLSIHESESMPMIRVRADVRRMSAESPALQNRLRFAETDLCETTALCQVYTMAAGAPVQSERSVLCDVGGEVSRESAAMREQQAREETPAQVNQKEECCMQTQEEEMRCGQVPNRMHMQEGEGEAAVRKMIPSEGSVDDGGDVTYTEDMTRDREATMHSSTMPAAMNSDVRVVNQTVMA